MAKAQNKNPEINKVLSGKTEKIYLFYDGTPEYSAPLFVGINGMTWMVRRGEEVEVPVEVAEVIRQQLTQDQRTAQMIQSLSSKPKDAEA